MLAGLKLGPPMSIFDSTGIYYLREGYREEGRGEKQKGTEKPGPYQWHRLRPHVHWVFFLSYLPSFLPSFPPPFFFLCFNWFEFSICHLQTKKYGLWASSKRTPLVTGLEPLLAPFSLFSLHAGFLKTALITICNYFAVYIFIVYLPP